jgi:DNA-binding transcriptional ArsR family regulator
VPIRFAVPTYALDRLAFAYSPLLEAVLSLHVLVEPKHHPLQHGWVRRMRALPPALKRRIADFGFAYRRSMPEFLAPSPEADFSDFAQDLTLLQQHEPAGLALDFLRPLYDHGGVRDTSLLEDENVRTVALERSAQLGASGELVSLIFEDPAELTRRFADLMTEYWDAAFADVWERLEPRLAESVSQAGRQIAAHGIYSFLGGLSPGLRVDPEREEFGLDLPHDHRVEITEERKLVLVPSAFVWPHVRVGCDDPWPLSVVYPAAFVADEARLRIPSADLVGVLRGLGDATRLQALRLIAERPRSTQELARLVGITEAGLSKHLRQLAAAGLVTTRREGYYVLYSIERDRIGSLSDAVFSFLEVSDGRPAPRRRSRAP